jgi:hypothetical protein
MQGRTHNFVIHFDFRKVVSHEHYIGNHLLIKSLVPVHFDLSLEGVLKLIVQMLVSQMYGQNLVVEAR